MRVGERHAHRAQPIKVGRLGLGIDAHVAHPVVQVVDGDEENIWAAGRVGRRLILQPSAAAHAWGSTILGSYRR